MADPRQALQATFDPLRRHAVYGEVLVSIRICGIRAHADTLVNIESPVTAFCGINGSGKSTVLQLAAAAYQAPEGPRHYVSSFILAPTSDNKPFRDDAWIEFEYAQPPSEGSRSERRLTLSRVGSSWSGYDRQPARHVLYLGSTFYLPHAERDAGFKALFADASLRSEYRSGIAQETVDQVSKILLCKYDGVDRVSLRKKYARQSTQIVTARRTDGTRYSESNMGSGEARLYALVLRLETVAERSLVLIEEPETALHPCAQFETGKYLMDVAQRRHLQILVTTHSEYLLLSLPQKSRIYLKRAALGVEPIAGVGVRQAISLMDNLAIPSIYILVEDDLAEVIVAELLRALDADFLKTVRVAAAGSREGIKQMMSVLSEQHLPVCAVLDGDSAADVNMCSSSSAAHHPRRRCSHRRPSVRASQRNGE